jgi:hypothetical protein
MRGCWSSLPTRSSAATFGDELFGVELPDHAKIMDRAHRELIFGVELKLRDKNNPSNAPNSLEYLEGVVTTSQGC